MTELIYEARQNWLEEFGRTEGDVMEDEHGEYVLEIIEDEDSPRTERKIYLPSHLLYENL